MKVSLCVIAYNEEEWIDRLLGQFVQQDYPHDKLEILLIDSNSTDNTRARFEHFKQEYEKGKPVYNLKVIGEYNDTGTEITFLPDGDVILKVDAHAEIPDDFVSKNIRVLKEGEAVVGGQRPNIIDGGTSFKRTLLLAETSMFGSSIASYRRVAVRKYISSIFHGAYKREVFAKIGGFNENLWRTEDNEIHYRIRKAGYQICFEPDIISYQHTRSTLPKMLKQKYSNGYWIGLTLGICPGCISIYHLVPLCFLF